MKILKAFWNWLFNGSPEKSDVIPFYPYRPMRPKKCIRADYNKEKRILTCVFDSGVTKQYKGSSTVWYTYPMMERVGTSGEARLADIIEYIEEHGNPYPTAHLKIIQENQAENSLVPSSEESEV